MIFFSFARIVYLFSMYVTPTLFIALNLHWKVLLKESGIYASYGSDDPEPYFYTPETVAQCIHTTSSFL